MCQADTAQAIMGQFGRGPNRGMSQSGITPRYQPMSPFGSPQGTQAPEPPDIGQPQFPSQPPVLGPQMGQPKNPFGWRQRLGRIGQGFQAGQQGAQMFQQQPVRQGGEYRPQGVHAEEFGQGPLSRGILDDYLRTLSASEGITY